MVTKAEFAKLRGHHLDALRYLSGSQWGCREGPVEERREATWASLVVNSEARSMRISALLWGRARELGNRWTIGQLEPFKNIVQWEIEAGDTTQDQATKGESSGGAMGNVKDMDVNDTPLAVRQHRLHGVGQAGQAGR